MFRNDSSDPGTAGQGFFIPAQRRSDSSLLQHKIVAARASAVVLEREGEHERAARLRAEADRLERSEPATIDLRPMVPVRVRRAEPRD